MSNLLVGEKVKESEQTVNFTGSFSDNALLSAVMQYHDILQEPTKALEIKSLHIEIKARRPQKLFFKLIDFIVRNATDLGIVNIVKVAVIIELPGNKNRSYDKTMDIEGIEHNARVTLQQAIN